MNLALLFLFPFAATLFAATANAILALLTCHYPIFWTILVPAGAAGCGGALLCALIRRYFPRFNARFAPTLGYLLCFAVAALAFLALGKTESLRHVWNELSIAAIRPGAEALTYAQWKQIVHRLAMLWLFPATALVPLLWGLAKGRARGRLALFFGACCGLIFGHLLIGCVPTRWLLQATLGLMIVLPPLCLGIDLPTAFFPKRRWLRLACLPLAIPALLFWLKAPRYAKAELLTDESPFALIAARDYIYTPRETQGLTFREGRLIRAEGRDLATHTVAQLIPFLLKPVPGARIAIRSQSQDALLPMAETGKLKGLYDAIFIELPPAWLPEEADFFGSSALGTVQAFLKPDGLLVYALDTRSLTAAMMLERISLLEKRFPHLQIWCTGRYNWQIVASQTPITCDYNALATLLDREEVTQALYRAGLEPSLALLSCFLIDHAPKLRQALQVPVAEKIPRGEAQVARENLFQHDNAKDFCAGFADQIDNNLPWLTLSAEDAECIREDLLRYREARRLTLTGSLAEAAMLNTCDPFLAGLADRELITARDWEKLGNYRAALASYDNAFRLTLRPKRADLLAAAKVALYAGAPEKALLFYETAIELYPEDLHSLSQYANFLYDHQAYADAERIAKRALPLQSDPAQRNNLCFFLAKAIAHQPGRAAEGHDVARAIAQAAETPEDKEAYIIAYADLLIETGEPIRGVNTKRYFAAYKTLLPLHDTPPPAAPAQETP